PILRTPVHDMDGPVPADFLLMLAIASVWLDPGFREMMQVVLRKAESEGLVSGIISSADRPLN
ncbi:MAG: hypothetical protein ABWY63_00940, partial [Hyphomicrobiaceae bacterium]